MTEPAEYARQIETYLCRKNGGHLVRVVGPAFEMVCGWAARGLPLKVAFRGIDRCCERDQAKGTRRRPVRIEFCEADVLDVFDEWRRAVGVGPAAAGEGEEGAARRPSLAAHIERATARLAFARGAGAAASALHHRIDVIVRELEVMAAAAAKARGEARAAMVARLETLDAGLMQEAIAQLESARAAALQAEAAEELAPFASRMAPDVRERTQQLAFTRLVRQTLGLPVLSYD